MQLLQPVQYHSQICGVILESSCRHIGITLAILGSSWHNVGGMLGSLLYFSWIIFRLSWNHFGVILGSFSKYLGLILRSSWHYIGTSLGSHWGHRGKKIFSSNGVAPDNFWDHIGNTFGPSVDQSEFILGSFYIHFGIILSSSLNHVGVISDSFWCHLGVILALRWSNYGIILALCWSNLGRSVTFIV